MGALREKMIEEIRLRNFSPRTEQSYVAAMVGLVKHYHRSPDQLTQDEIRSYLLHLKERGLSPSSRNVAISGMKFFYHQILGWDEQKLFLPPRKGSWRLLAVAGGVQPEGSRALALRQRQTSRPLSFDDGLRHGSSAQRIGQAQSERQRMTVRVEQGKGKKDRYSILSQRLLEELRSYWKVHRSKSWLFPNAKGGPLSIDYAQRIYNLAKLKAGIHKGKGIHTLRHCFATHLLEAGVDLVTIKTLLGHNSLQSTQRYLQIRQHKLTSTGSPLDLLRFSD